MAAICANCSCPSPVPAIKHETLSPLDCLCGHALVDHEMDCPSCAERIKADASACRFCGQELLDEVEGHRAKDTNGFAVASIVFAVVFLAGIGSVLAIIFGVLARRQLPHRPDQKGSGLALAGIILGTAWLAILIPFWVAAALGWLD